MLKTGPPHSRLSGNLFVPQSLLTAEGTPLRRFPTSPTVLRDAIPPPPIRELGEAGSPRLPIGTKTDGGADSGEPSSDKKALRRAEFPLRGSIAAASAMPPMLLGGKRVSKPSSPAHLTAPHGDGSSHRHLRPFRTASSTSLPPSAAFCVPRTSGSGIHGGSPRYRGGADPTSPIVWRASLHALPTLFSPTRMSGTRFAHRGTSPPPDPSLPFPAIPYLPRPLMLQSPRQSASYRQSSLPASSKTRHPRFPSSSFSRRFTPHLPHKFGGGPATCWFLGSFCTSE